MSEPICTCHCGGSMFYRHLHSDSCELSRVGEEAPMSPKKELQALRDEVARLRRALEIVVLAYDVDQPTAKLQRTGYERAVLAAQAALTPQAGKGGGA